MFNCFLVYCLTGCLYNVCFNIIVKPGKFSCRKYDISIGESLKQEETLCN